MKYGKTFLSIFIFIWVSVLSTSTQAQAPELPLPGVVETQGEQPELAAGSFAETQASMPIVSAPPVASVLTTNPSGFQNEAHIAVNPCNHQNVVVSMNYSVRPYPGHPDSRDYDAMVATSFNGGQTWQTVVLPGFPADGGDISQGDATLAFTASPVCRLLYTAISFNHFDINGFGGLYTTTSNDGGLTWGQPVKLDSNTGQVSIDKSWVAASPISQQVTACWGRIKDGWDIWCSKSADSGLNWNAPIALPPAREWNVGVYPHYGADGTLYVSLFSMGSGKSEVMFYRQDGDGSWFSKTVWGPVDGDLYAQGMMPALSEAGNGTLHLSWGDGHRVWLSRSFDRGNNWTPAEAVGNVAGKRFLKPWNCTDPLGRVYVGAHVYDVATHMLQVYVSKVDGSGWYPVGPAFRLVGDIDNWDAHRQAMGDYNACANNQSSGRPGIAAAFVVERAAQSYPPGYIPGADNDVHAAQVTTVPWLSPVGQVSVFRPTSGSVSTAQIPLFNEGIESGVFKITTWSGQAGCPAINTVSTAATVPARGQAQLLISVGFNQAISDSWCEYQLGLAKVDGTQPQTVTLRAWQGEPYRLNLPIVFNR